MAHEAFSPQCINIAVSSLTVLTDIARVQVPYDCTIITITGGIGGSLRTLITGTETVTLKNDAGTLIATLDWTAGGLAAVTLGAVTTLSAGDSIHVSVTATASGAANANVFVWIRQTSIA